MIKAIAKKDIDLEICRSLGLCEVVEKKETIEGKEKKFPVEKYRANGKLQDTVNAGDEIELEPEQMHRRGIYSEESFNEKLGALFSYGSGLASNKAEAKKVSEKEMKVAKQAAKIEAKANEEVEKVAEKEAKK